MNGSSVFISNVDDYLSPSQACVNPLYNSSTDANNNDGKDQKQNKPAQEAPAAVIVPRQRKRRPRATPNENGTATSTTSFDLPSTAKKADPIKASMADCLACSGCVTTAETVLLEQQHSLTALKTAMNESVLLEQKLLVATISPAVWADMLRHLQIPAAEKLMWQQRLATALQQILGVAFVLDGNLPLQWSLLESGEEFCRAYQQKHGNNNNGSMQQENGLIRQLDDKETPSVALNSQQAKYMLPDGSTQIIHQPAYPTVPPALPLLTSACPALVCLVEKSSHGAVRHLSHAKSPMSMAGAWLSQQFASPPQQQRQQQQSKRVFHLAFMPCHDKKLEASRKDFARGPVVIDSGSDDSNSNNQEQDVDLVLTTQEWFQMIVEYCQTKAMESHTMGVTLPPNNTWTKEESLVNVRAYLESLAPAPVHVGSGALQQGIPAAGQVKLLVAQEKSNASSIGDADTDMVMEDQNTNGTSIDMEVMDTNMDMDQAKDNSAASSFFTLGSGGLAEFVFRYAAWRLFDAQIIDVIWKPVATAPNKNAGNKRAVSARIQRRAAANTRDYHSLTLYRHTTPAGSFEYSCNAQPGGVPVLRFAIAYGLQTVQRVLEPFQAKNASANNAGATAVSDSYAFDFVEAMACPSGCLNGGGQLRVADRETPSQTRERVAQTRALFSTPPQTIMATPALATCHEEMNTVVPGGERQTRFHVVPPLAHSMGAAAGVAVKDTQW